jgi:hypothetical protein
MVFAYSHVLFLTGVLDPIRKYFVRREHEFAIAGCGKDPRPT